MDNLRFVHSSNTHKLPKPQDHWLSRSQAGNLFLRQSLDHGKRKARRQTILLANWLEKKKVVGAAGPSLSTSWDETPAKLENPSLGKLQVISSFPNHKNNLWVMPLFFSPSSSDLNRRYSIINSMHCCTADL